MSDDELRRIEARGTFGNTPAAARLECLLAATGDGETIHRIRVLLNRALVELKEADTQIRGHSLRCRVIILLRDFHLGAIEGATVPVELKTYMKNIVITRARRAIRESVARHRGGR